MKKISLTLITLFTLAVLILSACASGGASASPTGEWRLISYGDASNPTPALPIVETSINFNEDGTFGGSVDEFQRLGYLQELNRRFLHPLGLSMVIIVDDKTGEKSFYHIGDFREEGICFDKSVIETKEFNDRQSFIDEEFMKRTKND
jgi:hypothetical protein